MSYTELHIGKFSIVATGTDEIDAFIKANKLEDKVDRDEYRGEVTYYIDSDEGYEFVTVKGKQVLIAYDIHQEEEASDYVSHITKSPDGTYDFVMMFYNGGTCLSEMIGDELARVL